jgi:hypothetical protein
MLERIRTSLTKPPLAVFFIKDSWGKVVRHLFLMPLLLLLPLILTALIRPGMDPERYQSMKTAVTKDIIGIDTKIDSSRLIDPEPARADFAYYTIYVGEQEQSFSSLAVVFEEEHLVLMANQIVIERASYEHLGLIDFDFADPTDAEISRLTLSIKSFLDDVSLLLFVDLNYTYIIGLIDYVLMTLFMTLVMMLFIYRIELPFKHRFKLSVYLTTVYVVVELILVLFDLAVIGFISILVTYIYHVWAYRSIHVIPKGAVK